MSGIGTVDLNIASNTLTSFADCPRRRQSRRELRTVEHRIGHIGMTLGVDVEFADELAT